MIFTNADFVRCIPKITIDEQFCIVLETDVSCVTYNFFDILFAFIVLFYLHLLRIIFARSSKDPEG